MVSDKKRRKIEPEQRRAEILSAAMVLFAENGFAATRMEDVAVRAGIAKGTVYLHFPDKEALFSELISGTVSPIVERLQAFAVVASARSCREQVAELYTLIRREIIETDRRHLLRLMIAEGPRFPKLAEHYYRNVTAPGISAMQMILKRGAARGELRSETISNSAQLLIAPVLLTIIWNSLFAPYEALDADLMFTAFLDSIFVPQQETRS